MSTPNFLAVVCVVDSSLSLLAEWPHVFANYVSPLFQRLYDIHPGYQELREEPSKHGIGHTGSGGLKGMATLEGIVAAVELFDTFKESLQDPICHIIHITACAADSADRPLWNSSSRLDMISWDNLPAELRKRDIHYSNILLQSIPALSKFQSLAASGASQGAWFPLRSPHSAHLNGFNSQKGSQGTKRGGEPQTVTDRSPDAKRPRVQPGASQASPKATPKIPSAVPPTQATVAPSVAPVPSSSGAQPPAPPAPPQSQLAMFASRWKAMSQVIKQKSDVMEAHKAAGRAAEAAALKAEVDDMKQKFQKMTQMLQAHAKQQQAAQGQQSQSTASTSASQTGSAAPQVAVQSSPKPSLQKPAQPPAAPVVHPPKNQVADQVPDKPPSAPAVASVAAQPPPPVVAPPQVAVPHAQSQAQALGAEGSHPTVGQGVKVPPNVSPQVVAQMQKMMEQRNRTPQISHATVGGATATQGGGMWQGTLTWRGSDSETQVRKELHAQVIAQVPPNYLEAIQFGSWPGVVLLTPSRERALPPPVLQEWIKRHQGLIFGLAPNPQAGDAKTNEDNLKILGKLLSEKNIYALGAWGKERMENRVLLFWVNNRIMGSYFGQVGGMPELPRNVIGGLNLHQVSLPMALVLSRMPAEMQAQMEQIPVESRSKWLQALMMKHAQARSMQQQQQQGQGVGDGGGGMHQRTGSNGGGGLANVPPDVLQSFMQRRPDVQ